MPRKALINSSISIPTATEKKVELLYTLRQRVRQTLVNVLKSLRAHLTRCTSVFRWACAFFDVVGFSVPCYLRHSLFQRYVIKTGKKW